MSQNVKEYSWLTKNKREVRGISAYAYGGYKKEEKMKKLEEELRKKKIELISSKEIIEYFKKKIKEIQNSDLKTNNQLVKMIQLWLEIER